MLFYRKPCKLTRFEILTHWTRLSGEGCTSAFFTFYQNKFFQSHFALIKRSFRPICTITLSWLYGPVMLLQGSVYRMPRVIIVQTQYISALCV